MQLHLTQNSKVYFELSLKNTLVIFKVRNSYRDLQNAYFKHISEKGFKLERGELVEVTNRKHYSVQEFKQITNFENTKKVLEDITFAKN